MVKGNNIGETTCGFYFLYSLYWLGIEMNNEPIGPGLGIVIFMLIAFSMILGVLMGRNSMRHLEEQGYNSCLDFQGESDYQAGRLRDLINERLFVECTPGTVPVECMISHPFVPEKDSINLHCTPTGCQQFDLAEVVRSERTNDGL